MDPFVSNLLLLLAIFVISSLGSRWMMHKMGYIIPASLKSREAKIIVAMKIILMAIWAIVLILILWLVGVNPLQL